MNDGLNGATDHASTVTEKVDEAIDQLEGLDEFITTLHSVLMTEGSGHAATLLEEAREALALAKDRSELLTGCLEALKNT